MKLFKKRSTLTSKSIFKLTFIILTTIYLLRSIF